MSKAKKSSVCILLKVELSEFERQLSEQQKTPGQKMCRFCIRIMLNVVVIALLGGAGVAIYYSVVYSADKQTSRQADIADIQDTNELQIFIFIFSYLPQIVLQLVNNLTPFILNLIVKAEDWKPVVELKIKLLRLIVFRLMAISALLWSIYSQVECPKTDQCGICPGAKNQTGIPCWENYVGKEMWKTAISDFLICFFITFFVETFRTMIRVYRARDRDENGIQKPLERICKIIGEIQFSLEDIILSLVYLQTILWLSYFFAPVMPAVGVILLCLYFGIYIFKLYVTSVQSTQSVFRATGVNELFMTVLMVSYLLVVFVVGFVIDSMKPSMSCGPFRNNKETIIESVSQEIKTWAPPFDLIVRLTSAHAFLIVLGIIVVLAVFYYRSVFKAYQEMSELLRRQLQVEINSAKQRIVETQVNQFKRDSLRDVDRGIEQEIRG